MRHQPSTAGVGGEGDLFSTNYEAIKTVVADLRFTSNTPASVTPDTSFRMGQHQCPFRGKFDAHKLVDIYLLFQW